ncbi:MAG: hypothetical protein Q4G02_03050 [bacterium]|nr:hypothetical protein [bacterium]
MFNDDINSSQPQADNEQKELELLREIATLRSELREIKGLLIESQHQLVTLRDRVSQLETKINRDQLLN